MTSLTILPIEEAARLPGALCERLFPKRMKHASQFRQRDDALRCIAAGALTTLVLGAKEEELVCNPWGKPLWTHGGLCFSLSHSGDYALLATDETEVGVDIEKNSSVTKGIAERAFTENEIAWMNEECETRFFSLWTMKESVMKLDGRGFSLAPQSFSVLPLLYGGSLSLESGTIYGCSVPFRDCTLSVCALHPIDLPPIRVLSAQDLIKNAI